MPIQGMRTTSNFATDERPKNWREGLIRLYPNGMAPLTALTAGMKKQSKIDDPEFNWWEKALASRQYQLGASITNASGQVKLTFAAGFNALLLKTGDILYAIHTGEQMRVSTDPVVSTEVWVQRGFAGTTPTAITYNGSSVNPMLSVIGSAFEEGSLAPTGVANDPTKVNNYTQIFRSTFEMTRTAMRTKLRTTAQVAEAKRECLEMISVDMERGFFFGQKSEGVLNGKPVRTTGGIASFIPSANIFNVASDYSGGITLKGLEAYFEKIFSVGSNEKMVFMGNRAFTAINQAVRKNGVLQLEPGEKEYGFLSVNRLKTGYGTLVMKTHPLFNQMASGVNAGANAYNGVDSWAFVLDMANIEYKYIDDLMFQPKLEANGLDGEKSGYLAECGLMVANASTHFLLKNLTVGAAD